MSNDFQLVGNLELRYVTKQKTPRPKVASEQDVFDVAVKYYEQCNLNIDYEEYVIAMFLSRSGKLIGCSTMGSGSNNGCLVSLQKIASTAFLCGATNVCLVHNHPQTASRPSGADNSITRDVKEGLKTLDIRLLDHVIIGDYDEDGQHSYYSYNANGMM